MNKNMRKMFSEEQVVDLIKKSIDDGIIDVGIKIEQIGNASQLVNTEDEPSTVTFTLTSDLIQKIKSSKAIIFTMNNSFILTPLAQSGDTLACQSFAYDSLGTSMVARVRISVDTSKITFTFDSAFSSQVYASGLTPYALLLIMN